MLGLYAGYRELRLSECMWLERSGQRTALNRLSVYRDQRVSRFRASAGRGLEVWRRGSDLRVGVAGVQARLHGSRPPFHDSRLGPKTATTHSDTRIRAAIDSRSELENYQGHQHSLQRVYLL